MDTIKAKFIVQHPTTIKEKLAAWAFDAAETNADALDCLERIDCAACFSPAPIYYHAMASEIGNNWPEIDEALDSYRDATGEAWSPRKGQHFLSYLWFAYEWLAQELADEIRTAIESSQKE